MSIWNNKDDAWKQWSEELSVAEHDGGVMAVDCLSPGKEYVTVGADSNVKVVHKFFYYYGSFIINIHF